MWCQWQTRPKKAMRADILRPLDSQIRCFSDMFVCGLIMSSTVTVAIALMLEDTVLGSSGLEGGNSKSEFTAWWLWNSTHRLFMYQGNSHDIRSFLITNVGGKGLWGWERDDSNIAVHINLRQPLHTAAKNSPGRPGVPVKMIITKYGMSWRDGMTEDGVWDWNAKTTNQKSKDIALMKGVFMRWW